MCECIVCRFGGTKVLCALSEVPSVGVYYSHMSRKCKSASILPGYFVTLRWRRDHGRAFEVVMCELKRRLLGKPQILVDTNACTLDCGDGVLVNLNSNATWGV